MADASRRADALRVASRDTLLHKPTMAARGFESPFGTGHRVCAITDRTQGVCKTLEIWDAILTVDAFGGPHVSQPHLICGGGSTKMGLRWGGEGCDGVMMQLGSEGR